MLAMAAANVGSTLPPNLSAVQGDASAQNKLMISGGVKVQPYFANCNRFRY